MELRRSFRFNTVHARSSCVVRTARCRRWKHPTGPHRLTVLRRDCRWLRHRSPIRRTTNRRLAPGPCTQDGPRSVPQHGQRHRSRRGRHRHVQRHVASLPAREDRRLHRRNRKHDDRGRAVGLAAATGTQLRRTSITAIRLDGRRDRAGWWLAVRHRRVDPVPQVDTPGGPPAIWGADCWNITTVRYPPNFKRVLGATPLPGCSENHGINNPLQSPHPGGLPGRAWPTAPCSSSQAGTDLESCCGWRFAMTISNPDSRSSLMSENLRRSGRCSAAA